MAEPGEGLETRAAPGFNRTLLDIVEREFDCGNLGMVDRARIKFALRFRQGKIREFQDQVVLKAVERGLMTPEQAEDLGWDWQVVWDLVITMLPILLQLLAFIVI